MKNEQVLKNQIRRIAKEKNIRVNACWKRFMLERFLIRLSKSPYVDSFVFKGGFLLSYLIELNRETVDLDFHMRRIVAKQDEIEKAISSIMSVDIQDGFTFSHEKTTPLIQPHMHYSGFRISLECRFVNIRDRIQIDIGVGDKVEAKSHSLEMIQDEEISLLVYPLETIFAEKLETILAKGGANSRMKDFHDLYLLCKDLSKINMDKLPKDIKTTFRARNTEIKKIVSFSSSSSVEFTV